MKPEDKNKPPLTKDLLNRLFYFEDGYLRWKGKGTGGIKPGDRAGTSEINFYISVVFLGYRMRAHRIVWIMNNGPIPDGYTVDHKDNDPSNNDINNLRLATNSQNTANRRIVYKVNKSGYKGVFFVPSVNKWRAQIGVNNKCKSLGYFDNPELAHEAYKKAAVELHGEFANF